MSWLDANDVFLMEAVSRDRVDDLRDARADETAGEATQDCHWWWRRMSAARA